MELKDLKSDDYYYAEYAGDGEFVIVKGTCGFRPNLFTSPTKQSFWANNESAAKNNIRLASEEEIHWLDCCIKANEYISFEEALLSFIPIRESDPEENKELKLIYKKLLNLR